MAKELLAAVLEDLGPVARSRRSLNEPRETARTVLATRWRHRAAVVEISAHEAGFVAASARILQPHVAVVTCVGWDHYTVYRGPDAVAAEKARLVASLSRDGTAVLNADDVRVRGMAAACRGRVLLFGTSAEAELRASDLHGDWPERLAFTASWRGESARVSTRLVGEHWLPSVLAAMGGGLALGVPLSAAAAAVARVEPVTGRLSPVETAQGITFLRDDCKSPMWSVPIALEVLRRARAARKVAVFGSISDAPGNKARAYRKAASRALLAADVVLFVGPHAHLGLHARTAAPGKLLQAVATPREASVWLRARLRPGDLVLLKASGSDHLARLALEWTREVGCWRANCGRTYVLCDNCRLLPIPHGGGSGPEAVISPAPAATTEAPA
jgi:UDP-N-acetylmuramoyl-tripeptide--D-alanyl-D-alanine ligase